MKNFFHLDDVFTFYHVAKYSEHQNHTNAGFPWNVKMIILFLRGYDNIVAIITPIIYPYVYAHYAMKFYIDRKNFNYVQDSPIKPVRYGSQVVVGGVGEVEGVVGYVEVDFLVFP